MIGRHRPCGGLTLPAFGLDRLWRGRLAQPAATRAARAHGSVLGMLASSRQRLLFWQTLRRPGRADARHSRRRPRLTWIAIAWGLRQDGAVRPWRSHGGQLLRHLRARRAERVGLFPRKRSQSGEVAQANNKCPIAGRLRLRSRWQKPVMVFTHVDPRPSPDHRSRTTGGRGARITAISRDFRQA
jgi:hypothetical protein